MAPRGQRRADALSKHRIVDTAIEILDTEGESALTFRALAARLETGSGAIYWHVADKGELLAAAADDVIARVLADPDANTEPTVAIRAVALGIFDAIDARPWVGTQLGQAPGQLAVLRIYERIGGRLDELGVPEGSLFFAASALVNYILGVAGQNAANARLAVPGGDRSAFLAAVAARWTRQDPAEFPFAHRIAGQLADHDDRAQFLAGIDLVLAGITTLR
ncbi:TetR family transcriptional regulator [Nocardia sp. AG03]|uniref:TetR/AcrR family transcriptional regulator n=1 Tax=Nocardia sp. AG03 TaxID=3025312 RepID=UPI00241833F7|nr:TetR family transcriptional regulator [Nocardia sp. AG03]